jgi:hypothetical protein
MNTEKRVYVEGVWDLTSCNLDPGIIMLYDLLFRYRKLIHFHFNIKDKLIANAFSLHQPVCPTVRNVHDGFGEPIRGAYDAVY